MNCCKRCGEPLSDEAIFCQKCGCKVEEAYIQSQTADNIVVPKKKINVCSILAIIFGAVGIIPGLNFLFLPAAIILAIIGLVTSKNTKNGTMIASIIVVVVSLIISIAWMVSIFSQSETPSGNDETTQADNSTFSQSETSSVNDETTQTDNPKVDSTTSLFDGDCGITASAEIGDNIINYPELEITITNTTNEEIAAIQFYAVPLDVYGEEINSFMNIKKLYTDTPISPGETTTISYQLIDQSVKTVNLYVYSVYFSDGTEWGDKNALSSKILKDAPTIEVTVKS